MVRPNPKYDPVTGIVTTSTAPREPRPNPRYATQEDNFVLIDGYKRNLALEKKLQTDYDNSRQLKETSGIHTAIPAGWDRVGTGINKGGGWRREGSIAGVNVTDQEAINYLELVIKIAEPQLAQESYMCDYYPREANACRSAEGTLDIIRKVEKLLDRVKIQQRYPNVPEREILDNPDVYTVNSSSMLGSLIYENADTPWVSNTGVLLIDRKTGKKIEGITEIPSVLPQVFAEEEPSIINGLITPAIPEPIISPVTEPVINDLITDNMVTQKIDYFTIENGRAIGQITFTATQNFNPFYYNKNITNIIQFKDRNGVNILRTVKQNNLRFTETERDETIQYDEGMQDNIYSKVSSFVWLSVTTPTPFSKQSEFEIREKEPVKPISSGFMAAGVAGAIAGLVLLGFIVDSKVGKK